MLSIVNQSPIWSCKETQCTMYQQRQHRVVCTTLEKTSSGSFFVLITGHWALGKQLSEDRNVVCCRKMLSSAFREDFVALSLCLPRYNYFHSRMWAQPYNMSSDHPKKAAGAENIRLILEKKFWGFFPFQDASSASNMSSDHAQLIPIHWPVASLVLVLIVHSIDGGWKRWFFFTSMILIFGVSEFHL